VATFHENLISAQEAGTLDGLFSRRVRRTPDRPAYMHHERDRGWVTRSWREMASEVARWQRALQAEKLRAGDRVAVLLRNCPEWVMFDQAAISLGLITVPLYTDDRPDNVAYILEETQTRLLLIQDAGRWSKLAPVVPDEGPLERVVLLDDSGESAKFQRHDDRARMASNWLPKGDFELLTRKEVDPEALASIIFTSGTTGRSKGVMLSHRNILSVAHGSIALIDVYEEDVFLSFLPLSHTLERTGGYYLPVMTGSTVAYARSIAQLGEDLLQVRPTVMMAVPRIFERVYGRVQDQLARKKPIARKLFDATVRIGWKRFEYQQGRGAWRLGMLLWPLLDRAVASKIRERLGGRMRAAVSGGAPLPPEIARMFIALGVPIIQGYGLTETSPVVSVNPLHDNIPNSVGVPIRGVEVRIGADSELQVRGPGVMLGYWNNHAATARIIDREGWLATGDQARIEHNHIFITGRIKDILVLSNGEKVPPADMESAISLDPLFEQVMVIGEGRPFLSALLVLNPEHWPEFARGLGVDPDDPHALGGAGVRSAVQKRVTRLLKDFPGYAKIRQVYLGLEPWSVENGLMTPTLKVKRPQVVERFAAEIGAMYQG